jgi:pimeloyl-ACP methyl ester carboxylesterase
MTLFRTLVLAAALASGLNSAAALADPRERGPRQSMPVPPQRDADRAWQATRDGHSMPLPQLERRVMPMMGGADYLGPELNGDTYRFKFMQNGRVIWVDVDGQGRIVRRSRDH